MVKLIFALASELMVGLLTPIITWLVKQILGRIPLGPFLALTPARTAFGRSASVAAMLVGVVWIVAALSPGSSWWLTVTYIVAAIVAVGCGLAYATLWWPACLAAALLIMATGLDLLPYLSPWAVRIDEETVHTLTIGSVGVFMLAFLTTAIAIDALKPRDVHERSPNNPWGTLGKKSANPSEHHPGYNDPE